MTLSCAMIVRDAETTLARALKSVRPHVDELVIVDTGSDDGTCAIAAEYADRLTGIRWADHFGDARQHAHDLCTGDWVLHLDSDDELIAGWNIRSLLAAPTGDVAAYMLRYQLQDGDTGKPGIDFWRERVVKRDAYRWEGRIHEVLVPTYPAPYERFNHAHVLHHGSGDPLAKLDRNIRLLGLAHEDNPHDARTLFYLGRDLVARGDRDLGKERLESYLLLSGWPDEAYIARQLIGDCLRYAGDYGAAYRSDLQLLDIKPLWPQAYFALAQDCYFMQRFPESVHFCEIGRRLPAPDTNLFVAHDQLAHGWMIYQSVALYNSGRLEEAAALTVDALRLRPDDPQHKFNAAFFTAKLGGSALPAARVPSGG
jgi:glycosyltransferase involved in cell wall biosynthesis